MVRFDLTVQNAIGLYSAQWDFENDGVTDSYYSADLTHTYMEEGSYNACVTVLYQGTSQKACLDNRIRVYPAEPTVQPSATPTMTPMPNPTPTLLPPTPQPTLTPIPKPTPTPKPTITPKPKPTPTPVPRPWSVTLKTYNNSGHAPHRVIFLLNIVNKKGSYTAQWDFNNDGVIDAKEPAQCRLYTYTEPGVYQPCVTVTNDSRQSKKVCASSPVTILGPLGAVVKADPAVVEQGAPVVLNLTVTNALGVSDAAWDYEDDGKVDAQGLEPQKHIYSAPGDYSPRVKVMDQTSTAVWAEVNPVHVYDSKLVCGDLVCSRHEDHLTCPGDCPATFCSNGKDDDRDGLVDLRDPDCENAKDASEFTAEYFDAVLNRGDKYQLFDEWFISASPDGSHYQIYNVDTPPDYNPGEISEMIRQHIEEGKARLLLTPDVEY